ncbi:MAG: hypothetical protein ACP5UA_06535 [Candidatus Hydrogenedens sp.]
MSVIPLFFDKLRNLFLSNYIFSFYYIIVLVIILVTIISALFPYQTQNFFYEYLGKAFTRSQSLKIIIPDNCENDRICISSLMDSLKQKHKKILIKEVDCEKTASPIDMLVKGKGDIIVTSSISALMKKKGFTALSTAGEKGIYIIAPKNYNFEEFQMLAGKKIGFLGDITTGIYITEQLIKFYHFDVPPELHSQKIYNVEKSFSSGEIEAVVWVEGINSSIIRDFLSKTWYQIVPIQQSKDFSETIPGLHIKNLNISPFGSIDLICIKNILAISNRVPNSIVREVITAWFSSEFILYSPEYEPTCSAFIPPPFIDIHPVALTYFNKDKPLTRTELTTLAFSFISILIAILLLKQLFHIWLRQRNKPYEKELEKRWEEVTSLKYQWEVGLSNDEILIRLKRIKSIYNWALESYKQNFISEKEVMLLYLNILHQILEFNEQYFKYLNKNKTIDKLSINGLTTPSTQIPDTEVQSLQTVPRTFIDEKDKYLKTPVPQQRSREQIQQMLLFDHNQDSEK